MPILTPQQTLLLGFIVAPILFALSAFFTHAPRRRIIGALAAAITYGLIDLLGDRLAFANGWWTYPAYASMNLTSFIYIPAGLVAGGAVGLIGWRITRRYGMRGFVAFLIVWSMWGVLHDYLGVAAFASSNLLVFAPGIVPLIADLLLYGICQALAQGAMRWLSGAAHADALARTPQLVRRVSR